MNTSQRHSLIKCPLPNTVEVRWPDWVQTAGTSRDRDFLLRFQLPFTSPIHWFLVVKPQTSTGTSSAIFMASHITLLLFSVKLNWMLNSWKHFHFNRYFLNLTLKIQFLSAISFSYYYSNKLFTSTFQKTLAFLGSFFKIGCCKISLKAPRLLKQYEYKNDCSRLAYLFLQAVKQSLHLLKTQQCTFNRHMFSK